MLVFAACTTAIGACALQPKIGPLPGGPRLERIQASPNYRGDEFRNQQATEVFTGEEGEVRHPAGLPLRAQGTPAARPSPAHGPKPISRPWAIRGMWRSGSGTSSFFLGLGGKSILIDPAFWRIRRPVLFHEPGL